MIAEFGIFMRIDLWELAKTGETEHTELVITERIPARLEEPCTISVDYQAKAVDDYYLLTLKTQAELGVYCQRCAQLFQFPYKNSLELAVCNNDKRAESLAYQYESLTALHGQVNLEELVTDELHLYAPTHHENLADCDKQIDTWLVKDESIR